ncbi:hypothetical protein AN964_22575 [Heyndrickxia shackletonii]|uniref:Uncharacterized protein n=1 Tax=Heyndrickxia shackletonii TaxID=157838 RepID=A0A0Q3WRE1_9BACI|nr:hypothetical protein [Heyndrickxia shackletonii]KQL50447.1 hypothetical protein AN964_22575 [Heyndrickxia shackletonii]NEZ01558.1 hypothetical protein [Heyndrickxia shackletonii]
MGWYLLVNIIATTYWKHFGWWFLVVCFVALIIGLGPIEKRLSRLEEKRSQEKILSRYPFVKELQNGQVMTIEMKNGERLENVVLLTRVESELLIVSKSEKDRDVDEKKIQTIKLKRVKSIKVH